MLYSAQYALLALSYCAWAFILAILGHYLRQTLGWENFTTSLAWHILLGGLTNVCITGIQIAMRCDIPIPFFPILSSYGGIAHENHFANYISLAIASIMYLYAKDRLTFKLFSIGIFLLLTTLAFSGSRSTFVFLTILALLSAGLHYKCKKNSNISKSTYRLYCICLLLLPIFSFIQLLLYFTLPHELLNLPINQVAEGLTETTRSLRLGIWRDSWNLALQSPWLGIGSGQINWHSFQLLDNPNHSANAVFENAHNLFLHLFTEMGIAALALTLFGLIASVRTFKWQALNLESWWLFSILSIIGYQSMMEYPYFYTYFLGMVAILFGAGEEKPIHIIKPRLKQLLISTLPIFMLIGLFNLATMFTAFSKLDRWFLTSIYLTLNKSEQQQYANDMIWIKNHSLLAPYADYSLAITINLNNNNLDAKLKVIDSAMHFLPMQIIAFRHVALLKESGDSVSAKIALKRALLAFPTSYENAIDLPAYLKKGVLETLALISEQQYQSYLKKSQSNKEMLNLTH
jgi:O-antigen ligase